MSVPIGPEDATSIRVTSAPDSLANFSSTYSSQSCRRSLKKIHYHVILPEITPKRFKKLQSSREAAANDAEFTRALVALFTLLSAWEAEEEQNAGEDAASAPALTGVEAGSVSAAEVGTREDTTGIALILSASAPADLDEALHASLRHRHDGPPIWDMRNDFKYLRLDPSILGTAGLPQTRAVTALDLRSEWPRAGRRLHPSVITSLAAALPSMVNVQWDCLMPPRRLEAVRREIRSSLATTLRMAQLDQVTVLKIYLEDGDPRDQRVEPGDFSEEDDNSDDALSVGVGRVLKLPNITHCELSGFWTLDPVTVFAAGVSTGLVFGQALQTVRIESTGTTWRGQWLMTGDEDKASEDEGSEAPTDSDASEAAFDSADSDTSDFAPPGGRAWAREDGDFPQFSFRNRPDDGVFVPHLLPLVSCLPAPEDSSSPALRSLTYVLEMSVAFYVEYYAAGVQSESARMRSVTEEDVSRPRWHLVAMDGVDEEWAVPEHLIRSMESGGAIVSIFGLQS
ncbi:uncharacterized protein B0I36DRAFT_386019 [Microdochium trichocladiopsis]|uniref:Uncharacterized protein n=1 Tax=Microdochium trichocladiopsis TaxID=1682393 RepID=A0A9P8Y5V6_9PEZI|nr:uncharacterized protein B0I36DRAFT_386019 [Microdochium trichocladiopsis]KAH7028146.1 hypothetical protein B0I36DRAFT_386019 [Microdochium trichocladiopsis]